MEPGVSFPLEKPMNFMKKKFKSLMARNWINSYVLIIDHEPQRRHFTQKKIPNI